LTAPELGEDIHYALPRNAPAGYPERGMSRCRAAKVTGIVDDTTVSVVLFNYSGVYFMHDVAHDTECSQWTWHYPADCDGAQ
jgi:hypothetical protein